MDLGGHFVYAKLSPLEKIGGFSEVSSKSLGVAQKPLKANFVGSLEQSEEIFRDLLRTNPAEIFLMIAPLCIKELIPEITDPELILLTRLYQRFPISSMH